MNGEAILNIALEAKQQIDRSIMAIATAREMDDIEADDLDRLYQLYKIECERIKVEPKYDEFQAWLVERGTLDD